MSFMLKDKGGFLRVLEAVIAILLIAGAVSIILVRNTQKDNSSETIAQIQQIILEEISTNPELRTAVLSEPPNNALLNNTISSLMPPEYSYEFKICSLEEICVLPNPAGYYTKGDIYADEVSIAATLDIAPTDPKRLRLFMWLKE
ncbi:MAG: hypothetical protein AABW91_00685 [Nanoarchaeota archaeon]